MSCSKMTAELDNIYPHVLVLCEYMKRVTQYFVIALFCYYYIISNRTRWRVF